MAIRIPTGLVPPPAAGPVVATLTPAGDPVELFAWSLHGETLGGVLVRTVEGPRAWVDSCPHWNTPLSQLGDRVWNGTALRCTMHGATFDPDDGACTAGPCPGTRLTAMPIVVQGDDLLVHAPVVLSLAESP